MGEVLRKQSEYIYVLDCRKMSEKRTQVYVKNAIDKLKCGFHLKVMVKGPSCDECFGIMGLCEVEKKCELIDVTDEKGIYTYEILKE